MSGNDVIRRRLQVLLDALTDLRRYRDRFDAATLHDEPGDLEEFASAAGGWA